MKQRREFCIWKITRLIICGLTILAFTAVASAATVRGRLDRVLPNGARIPAVGVAVTVWHQAIGRSTAAYADAHGLYLLFNIRPGSGYYLEVWTSRDPRVPPTVYPISIIKEPYTDIPPIVVR